MNGIRLIILVLVVLTVARAAAQQAQSSEDLELVVMAEVTSPDHVRELLKRGAHVDARDTLGQTPLYKAAGGGNLEVVRVLLENHADIQFKEPQWGNTPLIFAAVNGKPDVVKLLLEKHADIEGKDNQGNTPLIRAADRGQVEVVRLLLENHANIEAENNTGATPLVQAVLSGQLGVVRFLMENHAKVKDYNGGTLLHSAAASRKADVARLLLDRGLDIEAKDKDGKTPLQRADNGFSMDPGTIKILLEGHANTEVKDQYGKTPLINAVEHGQVDVIALLLENHANIEAKDTNGYTALLWAASWADRSDSIIKVLLENHANIEAKTNNGETPLILASSSSMDKVRLLLENHANIEAKTGAGWTPIMAAANAGETDTVKLLLEKGASRAATSTDGKTALLLGEDRGHCNVVRVLAPDSQTDLGSCFNKLLSEYQKQERVPPAMRSEVIATALAMRPAPAIPEEARRAMVQANMTFKQAQNKDDYTQAAVLYRQAVKAAPWWADARLNASKTEEKLDHYDSAISYLKTFLECSPQDPEARAAQDHIYELEMRRDKQAKAAASLKGLQDKVDQIRSQFAGYTWRGQQVCWNGAVSSGLMTCTDSEAQGRNWRDFTDKVLAPGSSVEIKLTGNSQDTISIGFGGRGYFCVKTADYVPGVTQNVWHTCDDNPSPIFMLDLNRTWGADKAIYRETCGGDRNENCVSRSRTYFILKK